MADINSHLKIRRRRKLIYLRALIVFFGMGLILSAFWWLIFRSGYLSVKNIEIDGTYDIGNDEVLSYLKSKDGGFLSGYFDHNHLFGWPEHVSPGGELAQAKEIAIDKSYLQGSIRITVSERSKLGIWCFVESCYWFDDEGVLFGQAPVSEGNLLKTIHDGRSKLKEGDEVLDSLRFDNLRSVIHVLEQIGMSVKRIFVDTSKEEVSVSLDDGPTMHFSLKFPAGSSLPAIRSLVDQDKFSELQYVDFRIENRAYYK